MCGCPSFACFSAIGACPLALSYRMLTKAMRTNIYKSINTQTLLNHILTQKHGKRIAVIENEFGEVGVDDSLVKNKAFGQEDIIEMNNGCICCTVRGDLIRILEDLLTKKEGKFDTILIETTGLADPAPVAQTFFVHEALQAKIKLDAILTVVDAKHLVQHLDDPRPEGVENEAVEQLAFADRILLNKIDLVEDNELKAVEARIKAINAFAPIIRTRNAEVNLDQVLGLGAFDLKRVLEFDPEFMDEDAEHQHDQSVTSVGFHIPGEMNMGALEHWISVMLKEKGTDLFRYKGVLAVKGVDAKWIFQGVHMLFGASLGEKWGPEETKENRFVFIGRNLDHKELTENFEACLVTEPLRFPVGTEVRCQMGRGQWELGTIVAQWYEGNPYQISLKRGGKKIFAPMDDDVCIRSACTTKTRMT